MTADHTQRCRSVSPVLRALALAVALLLAAGCGGNSRSASSSHGSDNSSHSGSARETAETRLEAIGPQLSKVLADYKSGKKQQAYTLAKSVSAHLYEGTTEEIVSKVDPAGERQIDPLLAATLPSAISSGEPASQITALIHRAQTLAESCLATIHRSEG